MDGTKTTTNWIIAGLVALVVIIGGGWLIARERTGTMADANATSTEATTSEAVATSEKSVSEKVTKSPSKYASNPTTGSSGETVSVDDQPAGSSVTVSGISVTKPTWVAVRDSRPWYLGWKSVSSGDTSVTIPLRRDTEAGESYEVVFFVDDGDGQFAIHGGDKLVTTGEGAAVSATFKAQ